MEYSDFMSSYILLWNILISCLHIFFLSESGVLGQCILWYNCYILAGESGHRGAVCVLMVHWGPPLPQRYINAAFSQSKNRKTKLFCSSKNEEEFWFRYSLLILWRFVVVFHCWQFYNTIQRTIQTEMYLFAFSVGDVFLIKKLSFFTQAILWKENYIRISSSSICNKKFWS